MLRFLDSFARTLAGCGSDHALYSSAVHRILHETDAAGVCLAAYDPIGDHVEILHAAGSVREWNYDSMRRAVVQRRTVAEDGHTCVPVLSRADRGSETRHVWGLLTVVRNEPSTGWERQLLRGAAERVAAEIERRRANLIDSVLDVLLRKSKPIDVYSHALRELRRFLRYDHSASIMTMQRGTAQIVVRAEKLVSTRGNRESLLDSPRSGHPLRLTRSQTRYVGDLTTPLHLKVVDGGFRIVSPRPHTDGAGLWRVMCLHETPDEGVILCYPLIFGGQMLGLLRLAASRPDAFDEIERHLPLLERFSRLLAVTLYRSELYHQSDRQLQAVKEIGRIITEPVPVEEVCARVLDLALRVLYVQVGAVGLLEDGKVRLVSHRGSTLPSPPVLNLGQGIAGSVVTTGRSRAVPDVSVEQNYVVFNARVRSELVVPITYNREVIGFLAVESYEHGRFREEDEEVISFLEALANQAAIAIKSAQLHFDAVRRLSTSLTIDPALSTAGLQDLLIDELRDKNEQLAQANERLRAANHAKSEFLARMSHDLRGPLNVIVGLTNLLTDPSVAPSMTPDKQRESFEIIKSSGEVLSSLIGNILDLSALEAGKVALTLSPVDAGAAFAYLRVMIERLAAEHGRNLTIDITPAEGIGAITVDEEKFFRILINLVSNAVKFTPSGGAVSVSAHAEGPALHIAVSDTGAGIPAEHHEHVFEPFRRLEGSGQQGTGLGLAVVRQLVDLHGGQVWLDSAPGLGTTVHVVLPNALAQPHAVPVDDVPSLPSGAMPEQRRDPFGARVVLAVEDTPAHMEVLRLAVTSRGYIFHGVPSGEEAIEWLEEHRPDIVLLDMQLPGIDGFAVAAHIKGSIETHNIPVVAVTAEALSENEARARASGCDAYLTKPVDIVVLHATIDAVMAARV